MSARAWLVTCVLGAGLNGLACSGSDPNGLIIPTDAQDASPSQGDGALDAPVNRGDGSPAKASLSAAAIDFGASDCGGAAPANQPLVLSNTGGSALTWSASLDSESAFSIVGEHGGTLESGGVMKLLVAAKAIPPSATAGALSLAKLTVTTSDASHPTFFIPVSIAAQGATLSLVPATAAFGQLPLNTQAPDIGLSLTNSGNRAAQVTFDAPANPDFAITWAGAPNPLTVAPSGSASATARFRPTSTLPVSTSTAIKVSGAAVCGASAGSIALSGQGATGAVGVSPATLDFGLVDCGGQASAKTVTIFNTGNAAFNWTASLGKGAASPFVVVPSSGIVPASSQIAVSVVPSGIPSTSSVAADLYADTMQVVTDVPNDAPHALAIHEGARGAIITASNAALAFGGNAVNTTATLPLTLTNAGNAAAHLSLTTNASSGFSVGAGSGDIAAGGTLDVTASFAPVTPGTLGPRSASLKIATGAALCAPLPPSIALKGSATDTATRVTAGGPHTCAVATGGGVYCWGQNLYGELGNGSNADSSLPTSVLSLPNATSVTAGDNHSCALTQAGSVACWGSNIYGGLGNGGTSDSNVPVSVSNLANATAVRAGSDFTCALRQDSTVACWGNNFDGELGNGTNTDSHVPATVSNLTGATAISVGGYSACAIKSGSVYCWGGNANGQLGNGTNTGSNVPVLVSNLTDATAITIGTMSACAIRQSGSVVCWGDNALGQLGNGSNVSSNVPVAVSNLPSASAIDSSGGAHVCASQTAGGPVCWGANSTGQLGNGGTSNANVPVAVSNIGPSTAIATGAGHSCAIQAQGGMVCWGADSNGDLGQGQFGETSLTPASVLGL